MIGSHSAISLYYLNSVFVVSTDFTAKSSSLGLPKPRVAAAKSVDFALSVVA